MKEIKVALLGAGFVADVHMEAYRYVSGVRVVSVYARDKPKAQLFAAKHHIDQVCDDIATLLSNDEVDVVDICLPNYLHHEVVIAAAKAGKHIIVEKPLCVTLEQADEMIAVCKTLNRKLMYAEQLCFAPKYERVRQLIGQGAIGEVYMIKQSEKHSGPHSDWFYDIHLSGGGVLMDMGCHALAWFGWMLGNGVKPVSVYSQMSTVLHGKRTRGEDNAMTIIEFDNGVIGIAENSWARHGGMDDRIEVYGTGGVSYADLFQGNSALTFSEKGYDYAAEKTSTTQGWTFTMFEEVFNQGYPHELMHFIDCVREDKEPLMTGEVGKAVLELIYAAYASAGSGRKIPLPFHAIVERPIDLWLGKS